MEFWLLGPVAVLAKGRHMPVGGPRQRCVLAALAVDAGRPVTAEVIVDRVWGQRPPARARHALQAYVARLRSVLGRTGLIDGPVVRVARQSGGYLLDADRDLVDVHRFRRLLERAGDPGYSTPQRVAMLREGLDLWRGAPLADLRSDWAERVGEGWRQLRLDAVVKLAESELALGNAGAVVALLTEMLDEYPLAESLTAALMRALHAAARTAEALDRYTSMRNKLVDEFGVDPGAELQAVHRAILRGSRIDRGGLMTYAGVVHPPGAG